MVSCVAWCPTSACWVPGRSSGWATMTSACSSTSTWSRPSGCCGSSAVTGGPRLRRPRAVDAAVVFTTSSAGLYGFRAEAAYSAARPMTPGRRTRRAGDRLAARAEGPRR